MKYAISLIVLSCIILLSTATPPPDKIVEYKYVERVKTQVQQSLYTLPTGTPFPDSTISSPYGMRKHPVHKVWRMHTGIDWGCPVGTEIKSLGNGKIVRIDYAKSGYGINIDVSHGLDRDGNHITVRYAHLSSVLVKIGDFVLLGQTIAKSGNTGTSTGPHLHWELRVNGSPVNPLHYYEATTNQSHRKTEFVFESVEREYETLYREGDSIS